LDDGSLDKLALREQQPAVFERKEITAIPDVAIGILVDESGSMGGLQEQQARLVCIGLYEAFRKLRGLKLMVLGYTDGNGLCMMDHFSLTSPNPECISNICSMGGTPTNWAMEESIKKLCISYPEAKQRYLFVITDGSPNGGRSAMKHCHDISIWGKQRFGVNTYGIGVAGAPNQQTGEYTFGKGKFVCLPDVATSSRVIATFLARVTAKT
jgi:nitric oxide reductase activation protein